MNMRTILAGLIGIAFLMTIASCSKREISDGTLVTLLYTSDVRGKIEGCGCKHNGGGITKRSAKIAVAREEDPSAFYCDSGNFLTGTPEVDSTRGMLSVEAYNHLGASVVNVSERELAFGLSAFKSARKSSRFDYVSANIRIDGSPVADPYVVKKCKEARVAFLGLCGTRDAMRFDSLKLPENCAIEEPVVAARRLIPDLLSKADLIVVLSSCGDATDSVLAATFPEVALIIGGRSYRPNSDTPWVIGNTRVVRSQRDGRAIGRMDMVFGPDRKIKMYNPSNITMETSDPSDEKMTALVRKYIPTFVDNPTEGVRLAPQQSENMPVSK